MRRLPPPKKAPPLKPKRDDRRLLGAVRQTLRDDRTHNWQFDWTSNGSKSCTICGVTLTSDINVDWPDRNFRWIDAQGQSIYSETDDLKCPVFVGNQGPTAIFDLKQKADRLKEEMGDRLVELEGKLLALEEQNADLLTRASQPVLTADLLADALQILLERTRSEPSLLEDKKVLSDVLSMVWDEREKAFVAEGDTGGGFTSDGKEV